MHELQIYRGVLCYDNEEWCKVLSGVDMSQFKVDMTQNLKENWPVLSKNFRLQAEK